MKKTYYLIATILALILVVIFTLQNTEEVVVTVFFRDISTSKALLIFSLFSLGVMFALLLLTPTVLSLRKKMKKDEKIIDEFKQSGEMKNTNVEN
jgi:uncharacterized integral membrane protein